MEFRKHFNSYQPKIYMCRYRANQFLIVQNLYSVSINKILVTEFIAVKVSQNVNLMQNMSTQ